VVYDNGQPASILLMSVLPHLPNTKKKKIIAYIVPNPQRPLYEQFLPMIMNVIYMTLTSKLDLDSVIA